MVTDHRGNKWLEHSVIDPMLYVRVNGGFAVIKEVRILDYWHIKVNSSLYCKNIEEIERWEPKDYAIREVFGEKATDKKLRPAIIEKKIPRFSDTSKIERQNGKGANYGKPESQSRRESEYLERYAGKPKSWASGLSISNQQSAISNQQSKVRLASYDKFISSLVEPKEATTQSERLVTAKHRNTQKTIVVNGLSPVHHQKLNSTILEQVKRYDSLIVKAATKYNLDPNLLYALVYVESGGKKKAISPKKAMGLTQLTYRTAKAMRVRNVFDPEQNLMGGAKYLSLQMKFFGNERDALAAYNAGPGRVRSGNLPIETRNYIDKILYIKNILDRGKHGKGTEG